MIILNSRFELVIWKKHWNISDCLDGLVVWFDMNNSHCQLFLSILTLPAQNHVVEFPSIVQGGFQRQIAALTSEAWVVEDAIGRDQLLCFKNLSWTGMAGFGRIRSLDLLVVNCSDWFGPGPMQIPDIVVITYTCICHKGYFRNGNYLWPKLTE